MSIGRQGFIGNQQGGTMTVPVVPTIPARVFARWVGNNINNIENGTSYSFIEDTVNGVHNIVSGANQLLVDTIYGVRGWLGVGGHGKLLAPIVDNQSPTLTTLVWITNPNRWIPDQISQVAFAYITQSNVAQVALSLLYKNVSIPTAALGANIHSSGVVAPFTNTVDDMILVACTHNKAFKHANGTYLIQPTDIRIMNADGTISNSSFTIPYTISYDNPPRPFIPITHIGVPIARSLAGDPINPAIIVEQAFADGVVFTNQDFTDYFNATKGNYGL